MSSLQRAVQLLSAEKEKHPVKCKQMGCAEAYCYTSQLRDAQFVMSSLSFRRRYVGFSEQIVGSGSMVV